MEDSRNVRRAEYGRFSWMPLILAAMAILSAVAAYLVTEPTAPQRTAQTTTDVDPKPSE